MFSIEPNKTFFAACICFTNQAGVLMKILTLYQFNDNQKKYLKLQKKILIGTIFDLKFNRGQVKDYSDDIYQEEGTPSSSRG